MQKRDNRYLLLKTTRPDPTEMKAPQGCWGGGGGASLLGLMNVAFIELSTVALTAKGLQRPVPQENGPLDDKEQDTQTGRR